MSCCAACSTIPMRGVYELIELLLAGTFFLALPCVFLRDDNILVNTIDDIAPRIVPVLKRGALAACGRGARRAGLAGLVRGAGQPRIPRRHRRSRRCRASGTGPRACRHDRRGARGLFMFIRGDDGKPDGANDPTQARRMSITLIGMLGVVVAAGADLRARADRDRARDLGLPRLRRDRRLDAGAEDGGSVPYQMASAYSLSVIPLFILMGIGRLARQHGDASCSRPATRCSPASAARWPMRRSAPARCSARSAAPRSRRRRRSRGWRSPRCAGTATIRPSPAARWRRPERSAC